MLLVKLLRASHFGPTCLVTVLTLLLSHNFFTWPNSALIAVAIFLGQLSVGWSNDILDLESDRLQNRLDKPLVEGELSETFLKRALILDLLLCLIATFSGPLGFRGGLVHLLGLSCGLSYNLYFKFRRTSPLPYVLAFAALPSMPYVASNQTPPLWLVISGALFGFAAHFANVLKDMEADRKIGINGLPQILGTTKSILLSGGALILIASILANQSVHYRSWILLATAIGLCFLLIRPKKFGFPVIMVLAMFDVTTLLFSGVLR